MSKELIINVTDHETRVAFVENGNPQELFIERPKESDIAGNIYKGRTVRVLPGMQAAFVDIGLKQAAFIYVADVVNHYREYEYLMQLLPPDEDENGLTDLDTEKRPPSLDQEFMIEDLLHEGQEIVVQVSWLLCFL